MITKRSHDEKIIKSQLSVLFTPTSTNPEKEEAYKSIVSINPKRIPYSAISTFIFDKGTKNMSEDLSRTEFEMEYFSKRYLKSLTKYIDSICTQKGSCSSSGLCKQCEDSYIVGLKVYEHIELAHNQVKSLFDDHDAKIKELQSALDMAKDTEKEMRATVKELEEKSRNITSNYIAILGIFAAALMGAFGGITGFTSLFEHLKDVALGTILIVSGLGGLTVVAVLFILLQSIAKLTDRSLGSFDHSVALHLRYPVITTSVLLLVTVSFAGAALNLSLTPPKMSWAGLWWILPIIPLAFMVYFIIKNKKLNIKSSEDEE